MGLCVPGIPDRKGRALCPDDGRMPGCGRKAECLVVVGRSRRTMFGWLWRRELGERSGHREIRDRWQRLRAEGRMLWSKSEGAGGCIRMLAAGRSEIGGLCRDDWKQKVGICTAYIYKEEKLVAFSPFSLYGRGCCVTSAEVPSRRSCMDQKKAAGKGSFFSDEASSRSKSCGG